MDHIKLLNQVRSKDNVKLAFRYALSDRLYNDSYFDYFEIEYLRKYQDRIIEEILEELKSPKDFQIRAAYAYYFPKNDLCYRRMVYIPFKDLTIRYAFVIVLASYLDNSLSERCFANRRASGKHAKNFLLEDYYKVSVLKFRNWQKKCAEKYSVLIRTDISSFYDSVSHQYLIAVLAEQLSIEHDSDLLQLFGKLLCVPVISYSHKNKKVQPKQSLRQGLTIGNNLEGFLANLYLRDIDEAMQDAGIEFGRYNDDMRIFAQDRKIARLYLLILQEHLLAKGLNLNASKTLIAENQEEIEKLRTKLYDEPSPALYDPYPENEDTEYSEVLSQKNEVQRNIDREADDLLAEFDPDREITEDKEAKNFCKFLQSQNLKGRCPEHIEKLETILTFWQGSSKHASWLVVQSTYHKDIPSKTKRKALGVFFKVLRSSEALSYTKYRLLHHFVNLRKDSNKQEYRLIENLKISKKKDLKKILFSLLEQPAFELNITALYALKILGSSYAELEKYARIYIPKPLGDPILTAISYMQEPDAPANQGTMLNQSKTESKLALDTQAEVETDYEPDERDEFY